jgi:hypothetical protein
VQLARLFALAASLAMLPAAAVLTRADRDDGEYLELASRYGACVPLAFEGEGVLVAPRWILTSAWVAKGVQALGKAVPPVRFAAEEQEIEAVFSEGELALIRLRKPVTGVDPIPPYRGSDEARKAVVFVGHGPSGRIGARATVSDRRARGAINTIDELSARAFELHVKAPDDASDLQGALAPGEDGACAVIEKGGELFVAGIAMDMRRAKPGLAAPGDRDVYARVSALAAWIKTLLESDSR